MFINHLSFFNFSFLWGGGGGRPKIGYTDLLQISGSLIQSKMRGGGGVCLAHFLIDLKSCVSGCAQLPQPDMYGKY